MSIYQLSRSSDQDSSPRKKARAICSDSSDDELEFSSRRSVSQRRRRRKRFNSESRSDILTQIQHQILSPDELARRRRENTRNVLSRIEEEPDSPEYHGGGRKMVSSRRYSNSIQSSPYHQPSHSQEHEDVFKRPLSREHREVSLSRCPSRSSLRELHNDERLISSQEYRERREASLSRWPSHSSLRELPNGERQRSQEFRAEDEQRVYSLSQCSSRTSLRDIRYEDKQNRAQAVREHRAEEEERARSLSRCPSRTSLRDIRYEDKPSRGQAVREHRTEDEERARSLSRCPSHTSLRGIRYEDKPSRAQAVREHSLRMDEELRPRRREYYSDFDHIEDMSYSKRKELLQRIQPLRGSSRDRIQQLPNSHQERVQSVEDPHPNNSVLRGSLPYSCSLPRSQEERTRKRVPLTVWSSDSDSSEPVIIRESMKPTRQDPRTLILPEDIPASQPPDRIPSPSLLLTERLLRDESVPSGSSIRSIGVQTELQFPCSPAGDRISPTDSDSSIPETPHHSKRRKKLPKASSVTDAQSAVSSVSSSPTKQS